MLIPRRVKHRKQHHPERSGAAKGGTRVTFGEYGVQALEPAYITNRQIESARIAINRHIRRGGKVWINVYPDRPLTKKPAETRMERVAREALTRAIHKLPMKCRIVKREEF
jgi:large subunit ribosomal protein L16